MKKMVLFIFLGFIISSHAESEEFANKVKVESWSSDMQLCTLATDEKNRWYFAPLNDGTCGTGFYQVFADDISTISEKYLRELVCTVALKKLEQELIPDCDESFFDLGETESKIVTVENTFFANTYEKETGDARFHVKCSVKKERICSSKCSGITIEDKVNRRRPKVEVNIFEGPAPQEDEGKKENHKLYIDPKKIFRDGNETIG